MWQLELECGHVERRRPVFVTTGEGYGVVSRDPEDALPAPKRVQCPPCTAAAYQATQAPPCS